MFLAGTRLISSPCRRKSRPPFGLLLPAVRHHIEASGVPDGYNIGINVGEAAGQTVAHAHLHVIPRYRGDVPDPRGGIRWIIPAKAQYWETR